MDLKYSWFKTNKEEHLISDRGLDEASHILLQDLIGQSFASFDTEADGACALHSIMGVPVYDDQRWNLQVETPRALAKDILGPIYSNVDNTFPDTKRLEDIMNMLWDEYTVPHLDETVLSQTQESKVFFRALQNTDSILVTECRKSREDSVEWQQRHIREEGFLRKMSRYFF